MLVREAQESITLVTTADGLSRKLEVLLPSLEKAKKRGVKIRIAAPINSENKNIAKDFAKVGEIKNAQGLAARFMLVDGEQLMFMLLNDEEVHPTYDIGIWLNTEFFAQALESLFEAAWKNFKPVK